MKGALALPDTAIRYLAKHHEADQGQMDEFRDLVNQHILREENYKDLMQVSRTEFALYGASVSNLAA